jgi:hypothetical protein
LPTAARGGCRARPHERKRPATHMLPHEDGGPLARPGCDYAARTASTLLLRLALGW